MIFISRAVGISIMTKLNLTQLIRIFILSLLLAASQSHAEIKQVGADAVLAAMKKNFRIKGYQGQVSHLAKLAVLI